MEGYGIYWFVLEQLAQAGGFLPLKIIPVLAMQSQTQETKLKAVVYNYELFEINENDFFSTRLNAHLQIRKHLSDKGKAGALKRWYNRQPNSLPISDPNSLPISDPNAKESKGNKGNEINKENTYMCFELSEIQIGKAVEYLTITKRIKATSDLVKQLFDIFKHKEYDEKNQPKDERDLYRHFMNSLKYENIDPTKIAPNAIRSDLKAKKILGI